MEVNFYNEVDDSLFLFSVIAARYRNKWIFCKQKKKTTWELPGGTREKGESILTYAKRELQEESGALQFNIEPVCAYSVVGKTKKNPGGSESFGMLYFADVTSISENLDSEMEKIILVDELEETWTYPEIQPLLLEQVKIYLFLKKFYETLSFKKDEFIKKELRDLFSKDALLLDQNSKKTQTIDAYMSEFNEIITSYPILFKKGFKEKQLSFEVIEKKGNTILICSNYEKRYTKENQDFIEYGENYITMEKKNDTFEILNISYLDDIEK